MAIKAALLNIEFDERGLPKLTTQIQGLGDQLDDAAGKSNNFWSNALSSGLGFLGANIFGQMTQSLTNFVTGSFAAGLDFESQMAAISAVTGETDAGLKALQDLALQIGKDTTFGASEAAMAIEELAKAGVSTEQILSGAADATTALAAAGGVDLPTAASVMSAAMNQFGISGDQANRVADLLAAAAAKSATGVEEMGESLKYVGTSAAALGIPIEDVTTALSIMADQGMVGSMAGTSLNMMLSSLANPTGKAAEALNSLGLSFTDVNGTLKDMPTILSEVATATAGMTEAQRAAFLENVFGLEGGRAMNALLASQTMQAGEAGKSWQDYYGAVTESGVAAEQAAARMDSTMGALEELKGTLETIQIMAVMAFLPAIRGAIEGITNVLGVIPEWIGYFQQFRAEGMSLSDSLVKGLGYAVAEVFGAVTAFKVQKFFSQFIALVSEAIDVGRQIARVVSTVVGVAFDLLGAAFATLLSNLDIALPALKGAAVAVAGFLAWGAVTAIVGGLTAAIGALLSPVILVAAAAAVLAVAWQKNFLGIQDIVSSVVGAVLPLITQLAGYLHNVFSGGFLSGLKQVGNDVAAVLSKFAPMGALLDALGEPLGLIAAAGRAIGSAFKSLIKGDFTKAFTSLKNAATKLVGGWTGMQKVFARFLSDVLKFAKSGIDDLFGSLIRRFPMFSSTLNQVRNTVQSIVDVFASLFDAISRVFSGDFTGAFASLTSAFGSTVDAMLSFWRTIPTLLIDAFAAVDWSALWGVIVDAFAAIDFEDMWKTLTTAFSAIDWKGLFETGLGTILEFVQNIADEIGNLDWGGFLSGAWNAIQTGLSLAWDAISSINWGDFISAIDWKQILGTITDTAAAIGGWLAGVLKDIPWKDILSTSLDIVTELGSRLAGVLDDIPWKDILTTAWDIVGKLGNLLKDVLQDIPWKDILSTTIDIVTAIGGWISEKLQDIPWKDILSTSLDIVTALGGWISGKLHDIPWKDILTTAWDIVGKLGNLLKDVLQDIPWSDILSTTIDIVTAIGGWIAGKLKDIPWKDILTTTLDIVTELMNKVGDLGNLIVTALNIPQFDIPSAGEILNAIKDAVLEKIGFGGGDDDSGSSRGFGRSNSAKGIPQAIHGAPTGPQGGSGGWYELGSGFNPQLINFDTSGVATGLSLLAQRARGDVDTLVSDLTSKFSTLATSIGAQLQKILTASVAIFQTAMPAVIGGALASISALVTTGTHTWATTTGTNLQKLLSAATAIFTSAVPAVVEAGMSAAASTVSALGSAWASNLGVQLQKMLSATSAVFTVAIPTAVSAGLGNAKNAIASSAGAWPGAIRAVTALMRSAGFDTGRAATAGVAAGMRSLLYQIRAISEEIAQIVTATLRQKLRIASPSKATAYLGQMVGQGLADGMESMLSSVRGASGLLSDAALPSLQPVGAGGLSAGGFGAQVVVNNYQSYAVLKAEDFQRFLDTAESMELITDTDFINANIGRVR